MASRALKVEVKDEGERQRSSSSRIADELSIRARAYELWVARGCPEGSDQEDWFTAEQELMRRLA